MTSRLSGKVAVVTGAGSGIGREIARSFATEGAAVAVLDVNLESAKETVTLLGGLGGSAVPFAVDVSDSASVAAAAEQVLQEFSHVDVLVNNAGVFDNAQPMTEISEEFWNTVIATNLRGPFLLTRAFLPNLIASGTGAVINMSSVSALVGGPSGVAYAASKGGVAALTRQMAVELGPQGVRVNAILPGPIATPMTAGFGEEMVGMLSAIIPSRRLGLPQEVAQVALFLASDEASFVFGSSYVVDGGWTAQ